MSTFRVEDAGGPFEAKDGAIAFAERLPHVSLLVTAGRIQENVKNEVPKESGISELCINLRGKALLPEHSGWQRTAPTIRAMRVPLWLKLGWTVWVIVWVPLYWRQYGPANFLFFCDLGNLLILLALWLESSLVFSWQACGLLLFQTLYTIDLIGAILTGRHVVGGTEYMFDSNIPLSLRLLSLFHVVTPPLLVWAVGRLGYDRRGWLLQTLTAWVVVPINYFWRPELDVNWARGPFFREQHAMPSWVYLLGYLVVVPLLVYFPTHLLLDWWAKDGGLVHRG